MDRKRTPRMIDFSVKGYSLGKWERHLPKSGEMSVPSGTTVGDVLDRFDFPSKLREGFLLFVNGRPRQEGYVLQPDDALVFFPPLEGG
jgi:sulfur carrier protein ThiS